VLNGHVVRGPRQNSERWYAFTQWFLGRAVKLWPTLYSEAAAKELAGRRLRCHLGSLTDI
jgi:hypothetical protein